MATLTITTTGAQDQRIIAAFRGITGNEEATGADVKSWLIQHLKSMVHRWETQQAAAAAADAVAEMTDPT